MRFPLMSFAGLVAAAGMIAASLAAEVATPPITSYQFEFQIVRDSVILFEPVWIRASVTNISNAEVPRPSLTLFGSVIDMEWRRDPEVVRCVTTPILYPKSGNEFVGVLPPGETYVDYSPVGSLVWGSLASDSARCWFDSANIELAFQLNEGAFSGTLAPEIREVVLPLHISYPRGNDVEVMRRLMRARTTGFQTAPLRREILSGVLRDFPESRLVEHAYQLLILISGSSRELQNIASSLARAHPQSPLLVDCAERLRMLDMPEAVEELVSIVKGHTQNAPLLETEESKKLRRGDK